MATLTVLTNTSTALYQQAMHQLNISYANDEEVELVPASADAELRIKIWFIAISCNSAAVLTLSSADDRIFDFYAGNNWGTILQSQEREPIFECAVEEAFNFISDQQQGHLGNVFIKYTVEK